MTKKPTSKHPKARRTRFHFNLLDWLVLTTAILTCLFTAVSYQGDPFYLLAGIVTLVTGAFYMIFSAKGHRSNFIFLIISSITYIYIAWTNHFYGSMAINILYYVPCALIGFYLWGRNSNKNHEVKARKLTPQQFALVIIAIAAASIILKFTLDAFGGTNTSLDGTATIISLVANLFALLRYREQWLLWLVTDILQLIMWTTVDDPIIIVMRILYPVTALYGYISWRKLIK